LPSISTVHAPQRVVSQPTWAGQLALFAKEMDEKCARLDFMLLLGPVGANVDGSFHESVLDCDCRG